MPSYWLGAVLGLLLLSYTHILHTYVSDPGSGANTIYLTLLATGINEEYPSRFWVPLKHSAKAINTVSNSSRILPRTRHIPNLLPPTNHNFVQHPIATDIRWSTLFITIKYKHMWRTIIATSTIPRTVHSIPWPLIIRLRVHQYNVHPPLSYSFRWVLLCVDLYEAHRAYPLSW